MQQSTRPMFLTAILVQSPGWDIPWEGGYFPPFLYTEAPQAVAPSESSKTLIWHTRRSCDELQQPQPLLVVKPLHGCPEPPYHYVSVMVTYTKQEKLKSLSPNCEVQH